MFKAIVFHGRENHHQVTEDVVFFSSSESFSKNYGIVRPYKLFLNKPFNTSSKEDIEALLQVVGSLKDKYNDSAYNTFDDLVTSSLLYNDTWKLFKPYVGDIRELGYDGMIIYENGVQNYVSFDSSKYKLCNPKLQLAIAL